MESPPLTIRNITGKPVELRRFEHYGDLTSKGRGGLAHNFTSFLRSPKTPSEQEIAENAQDFSHQDVSVLIEPFKSTTTDVKPAAILAQTLRLTFETEGEKHRLDTLQPVPSSTVLTPLSQNPRFNYTAIHLPGHSHLTLISTAKLPSWMANLKDETPLSALSIPGTHNSPACHRALPSVRCQATSPPEQLENGVRFFDIRVQPEAPQDPTRDGLVLVHSVFPISLTGNKFFRDLVNEIFAFLDRNPSETVIISVKREGTGSATDAQLGRILRDHYAGDVNRWFTAPRIPTLGEARTKIVLLRRFGLEEGLKQEWGGAGWCIEADPWADNTPNSTCPSGDICVQDFYEVLESENIEKKIKYCQDHLERAAQCVYTLQGADGQSSETKLPFYINFLAASNFWKVGCWPEKIAAQINPAMVEFLCRQHNAQEAMESIDGEGGSRKPGDGSTGIVVCDWVGHKGNWDLVKCIVGMNAYLERRETT